MTGYGRGECAQNGFKITVESSSVNRKLSEIAVNLPRDLEPLEAQMRDVINRSVSRGRLTVRVVGNGVVTPTLGSYSSGTVVPTRATAGVGWSFANWSGAVVTVE